jgi:hypothetical protein
LAVKIDSDNDYTRAKRPVVETLEAVTKIAAAAGVIWYAILSISFNRFYQNLSVDPRDVGYNYATLLENSLGALLLTSAIAVPIALVIATILIINSILTMVEDQGTKLRELPSLVFARVTKSFSKIIIQSLVLGTVISIAWFGFIYLPRLAADVGTTAEIGLFLRPDRQKIFGWTNVQSVFPVRAYPVRVHSLVRGQKLWFQSSEETHLSSSLVYLGRSGQTVVLYDWSNHTALYVEQSDIVLEIVNCNDNVPVQAECTGSSE